MSKRPKTIIAFHPDTTTEERVTGLAQAIKRAALPKAALLTLIAALTLLVEDAP